MKKILYISTLILALGFVSCNKQDIVPNSAENQDLPTWNGSDKSLNPSFSDDSGNPGDDTDNGGIVDPNNDPDGKTRRN